MNTALKTVIQQALARLAFIAPDYSAIATDVATAIELEFDVRPRGEATVGICGTPSPSPVLEGREKPGTICELPSGHEGLHQGHMHDPTGNISEPLLGHWGQPDTRLADVMRHAYPSAAAAATGITAATAGITAAVDTDLALAHLARALTTTPHTLTAALTALAEWVNAGGDPTHLPKASATDSYAGLFGRYFAAEAAVKTRMEKLSLEVAKTVQANDVAGIVIDQAQQHMPGLFVTLDLRYGIADAFWDAGYRNEATTGETPVSADDERLNAWDTLVRHPFFAPCFATDGPLIDAMFAKLDALTNAEEAGA